MGAVLTAHVRVAAPAEETFAAATDWPGQQEWVFATRVHATLGTGHNLGDEIAARTGVGPVAFTDTMTITEWEPPLRCRVRHNGRLIRGIAVFEVSAETEHSSVFTWTEDLDLPLGRLGEFGYRLTQGVFRYFVQRSLDRFAIWAVDRR